MDPSDIEQRIRVVLRDLCNIWSTTAYEYDRVDNTWSTRFNWKSIALYLIINLRLDRRCYLFSYPISAYIQKKKAPTELDARHEYERHHPRFTQIKNTHDVKSYVYFSRIHTSASCGEKWRPIVISERAFDKTHKKWEMEHVTTPIADGVAKIVYWQDGERHRKHICDVVLDHVLDV